MRSQPRCARRDSRRLMGFKRQSGDMSPGFWLIRGGRMVAATPAEGARALVEPFVAGDHLLDPHQVKADQRKAQANRVIDQVVMQREEGTVEQREMNKPDSRAEQH